ncbi:MAG: hypothetical protein GY823_11955 [Flavobacteriaceae bacterium]|nr:hypothetical protein [Flavobacteriaceae bacterium]
MFLLIFLILLSTATVLIYILTRKEKSETKRTDRSTKKPINGSESVIPENEKSTKKPENIEPNDTSNTGLIIGLSIGLIFYFSGVAFSLYNNKGALSFASWFAILFPTGRSSFIVEESIKPKKRKTVEEKRKEDIKKELNYLKDRAKLFKEQKFFEKIMLEPTILKREKVKFNEKLKSVLAKGKNIKAKESLRYFAANKKYNEAVDKILSKKNKTPKEQKEMIGKATKKYQNALNKVLPLATAYFETNNFKDPSKMSKEEIENEMNFLRENMASE